MNKTAKDLACLDIVISIFNQEHLIERVLYGIFKNTTTPFDLILVFDGCTDKTESRAIKYIKRFRPPLLQNIEIAHANNVFETRANNIGFKMAKHDYMITIQDDMVINEYGWERRMTYPLRLFDDVIAVSSRAAQNIDYIDEKAHHYLNRAARELKTLDRNTFAIRDVINRGPVAFSMRHLRAMNFLNESYAPSDLDDADLCLRAWRERKLRSGAYWIDYVSRLEWGKTRAKDSKMDAIGQSSRNGLRIMKDHRAYLESKTKHSEDIKIPEDSIDYVSKRRNFKNVLYCIYAYPLRIHPNTIRANLESIRRFFKNFSKEAVIRALAIIGFKDVRQKGIKKTLWA